MEGEPGFDKAELWKPEVTHKPSKSDPPKKKRGSVSINGNDGAAWPILCVVHFDAGETEIPPHGVDILTRVASELIRHPKWTVSLSGHTSIDPDQAPNKGKLQNESRSRAVSAGQFLLSRNVPNAQICAPVGHGATRPTADNGTEEGRHGNRRVEVRVVADETGPLDVGEPGRLITEDGDTIGGAFHARYEGGKRAELLRCFVGLKLFSELHDEGHKRGGALLEGRDTLDGITPTALDPTRTAWEQR